MGKLRIVTHKPDGTPLDKPVLCQLKNFSITNMYDTLVRSSEFPGSSIYIKPKITLKMWKKIFQYYHNDTQSIISQMAIEGREEISWGDGYYSIFSCDVIISERKNN